MIVLKSIEEIRSDFPILRREVNGHPLAYLDNAATSQKPLAVLDAMDDYYRRTNANVHRGVHTMSEEATALYEGARGRVARFINASSSKEVIFTRNATEAINLVAYSWGLDTLKPGDEVLITQMEHHANIVPWQLICQRTGATLRYVPIDAKGTLRLDLLDDPACRLTWAGPRIAERDSEHPGDLGELRDALQPEDFVGFRCVLIPRAPRSNQPDRVCLRQNLDEHIP